MKKMKLQEKILIVRSAGVALGSSLIFLGIFNLLRISNDYFYFFIIFALSIIYIYYLVLEKKLEKEK